MSIANWGSEATPASGPIAALDGDDGALIDRLLAEQGDLTAVERFSQFHADSREPIQGRYYASLMPASPPKPGQQLAFEVDLDRCTGCKACVAACHSLNGLDLEETWRDVGLLIGGSPALPILQHVTTACHHCVDPACLAACPTEAYEKDPITGIVKHLDDQCFGCQYCTLACPYDVPKYHAGKGIVRKCDMCSDRLQAGEAPACVQACPCEAIAIRVVDKADVIAAAKVGRFLPDTPHPDYTLPTTVYKRSHPLAGPILAADHRALHAEHAHLPLVAMLVLTQASVGGYLVDLIARVAGASAGVPFALHAILSFAIGQVGLAAATLHLGRPLYAYRAILGIRHSWLSREVVVFGAFAGASAGLTTLTALQPAFFATLPAVARSGFDRAVGLLPGGVGSMVSETIALAGRRDFAALMALAVASIGLIAVGASVMVYHVCRRPAWRARVSGTKFFGSAVVLGLASWVVALVGAPLLDGRGVAGLRAALAALMGAAALKIGFEAGLILLPLRDAKLTPMRRTALLVTGPLRAVWRARLGLGLVGGVGLPLVALVALPLLSTVALVALAATGFVLLIGGELVERALFFAAVAKPKMPGR